MLQSAIQCCLKLSRPKNLWIDFFSQRVCFRCSLDQTPAACVTPFPLLLAIHGLKMYSASGHYLLTPAVSPLSTFLLLNPDHSSFNPYYPFTDNKTPVALYSNNSSKSHETVAVTRSSFYSQRRIPPRFSPALSFRLEQTNIYDFLLHVITNRSFLRGN
jgi:hypothetical protein